MGRRDTLANALKPIISLENQLVCAGGQNLNSVLPGLENSNSRFILLLSGNGFDPIPHKNHATGKTPSPGVDYRVSDAV
jgi:hypothetical protein